MALRTASQINLKSTRTKDQGPRENYAHSIEKQRIPSPSPRLTASARILRAFSWLKMMKTGKKRSKALYVTRNFGGVNRV